MKYWDGQDIRVGDRVKFESGEGGIVVASMDTDEYSDEHPKSAWGYLKKGVMISFPTMGEIHFEEPPEDLELISRAPSSESASE